jgi:hypothetical protein
MMKLLAIIVNVAIIAMLLVRASKRTPLHLRSWYWVGWASHAIGGVSVGLLYFFYYQEGDTLHYFNDGKILSSLARENFSNYLSFLWENKPFDQVASITYLHEPRALFFSKLVGLINLITFDHYWITSLYFSLLSFLGVFTLVKTLIQYYPQYTKPILFSFMILPSSVLWSCGVIKESLAMACVNYSVTAFILLYHKQHLKVVQWLLLLICSILLFILKYYFAAVLLPILFSSLLHQHVIQPFVKSKAAVVTLVTWLFPLVIIMILATFIHPNFYLDRVLSVIYSNYNQFVAYSNPEDIISFPSLQPTWLSILLNTPWAVVSGLYRPFLWEAGTFFQVAASLENLLLIILTIGAFPVFSRLYRSKDLILIMALIIYCFILCAFLTLSTPNFGTLIRYRVGFISFFTLLITLQNPLFDSIVNSVQSLIKRLVAKKP